MGNNSSTSNKGLNEHCYNVGYSHGSNTGGLHPDAVGDGIEAAPCTTNDEANKAYAKGYVDAMDRKSGDSATSKTNNNNYCGSGVSYRDNCGNVRDNFKCAGYTGRNNR